MPAIDLARLKTQAARLAEKFDDPEVFQRDLNELLGFYTNHTLRTSQTTRRLSVPAFRTPRPVLRQIESELILFAENQPEKSVTLTNLLWELNSLESRLLAAFLLGRIPSETALPALGRLSTWLNQSIDQEIRIALVTSALMRVRQENPQAFFAILEGWLASPQTTSQIWGMQALIPLLQDPQFENLPAVFRILRPAVLAAGPVTQLELQACLAALERVSTTETISFLRDILLANPRPMMLRIIRRILPALSEDLQAALRELLREQDIRV